MSDIWIYALVGSTLLTHVLVVLIVASVIDEVAAVRRRVFSKFSDDHLDD